MTPEDKYEQHVKSCITLCENPMRKAPFVRRTQIATEARQPYFVVRGERDYITVHTATGGTFKGDVSNAKK